MRNRDGSRISHWKGRRPRRWHELFSIFKMSENSYEIKDTLDCKVTTPTTLDPSLYKYPSRPLFSNCVSARAIWSKATLCDYLVFNP